MGTRSLTVFEDEKGREIAVLYRQYDGFPAGHGQELAAFLSGHRLVNGYSGNDTAANAFNGMNCLAARVVSEFKGGTLGNFYLYPAGTRDIGEEYIYTVRPGTLKGEITMSCTPVFDADGGWTGSPETFNAQVFEEAES